MNFTLTGCFSGGGEVNRAVTYSMQLVTLLNTERSYKREGSAPLETLGWFQSNFVMVEDNVTVTQLISSRMFICLFEQRMNKPRIK